MDLAKSVFQAPGASASDAVVFRKKLRRDHPCARAAMAHFANKPTAPGEWVRRLLARAHPNVGVVALAAKLARIAWAVLRHGRSFDHQALTVA